MTLLDAPVGTYTIDPVHSRIGFAARHAMVARVHGTFETFRGGGHLDSLDPSRSTLDVVIDMASVSTRHPDRDRHLRSPDFFDTDAHPTATFVSTAVRRSGDESFVITGDLTIKGITRSIAVGLTVAGPVVDPSGALRIGLEGSAVINRKDWGITFNAAMEAGGVLIGDRITLELEISAVSDGGGAP